MPSFRVVGVPRYPRSHDDDCDLQPGADRRRRRRAARRAPPAHPRRAGRAGRAARRRRSRRWPPWPTRCAWRGAAPRSRSRASCRPRPAAAPRTATSAASRPSSTPRCRPRRSSTPTRCWPRRPETAALGASEFCIVLAVRGPDERTMQRILELVPLVRERDRPQRGGQRRHPHRRAGRPPGRRRASTATTTTSRRPGRTSRTIVTTHTWEERFDTCELVREHGMELCCGVLLGMGESVEQRSSCIGQLREVEPAEVPINFLNPRPGTPLADRLRRRAARGAPLDRPVPPRPAVGHPALRRRPRGHAARAAGHGHDRRASTR